MISILFIPINEYIITLLFCNDELLNKSNSIDSFGKNINYIKQILII